MRQLLLCVVLLVPSVAACAQLGEDLSYDPTIAPMPVLASASSSSSSFERFDGLKVVRADKVFRDGETSRDYDGQTWICGNPECTVAVPQRSSPPVHAKDKPPSF